MYVCMYVCMCVCTCMYVCMHVCRYVGMYISMARKVIVAHELGVVVDVRQQRVLEPSLLRVERPLDLYISLSLSLALCIYTHITI